MSLLDEYPLVDFRRWIFLEAQSAKDTTIRVFHELGRTVHEERQAYIARTGEPPDGGILTELKSIIIPVGIRFVAFSYKGDFGWIEAVIEKYADSAGRRLGRILGDRFVLSDQKEYAAADCTLVDDKVV